MKILMTRSRIAWAMFLVIPALILPACTRKQETKTTQSTRTEKVTGKVTQFDDQTPADGPVTVVVQTDDGQTRTLRFGSLFTNPPPSQERMELYERVRTVRVGDRVEVQAAHTQDDAFEIQSIVVSSTDSRASADTGSVTPRANPNELRVSDSGGTYTYHVGEKFSVVLDANTYPRAQMSFEPGGVISVDSAAPQVAPPNYVAEFVAVAPGEAVVKNGNFLVTIRVVS